ncbi:poly-gamma-glutamate hydrolase family protein [Pseudomonadota bacterium]|nr:poly-gamma-glutamate hydrolase family protein [Pseudomonadota bacterium]
MSKYYKSYKELKRENRYGIDYQIDARILFPKEFLIVAPHGGTIEPGTSEITKKIAANKFNYYSFESLRAYGPDYISLHITSHLFDEPECIRWSKQHKWVVTLHGCNDQSQKVYLGGLNQELKISVKNSLIEGCFSIADDGHKYGGVHRRNICNIGKSRSGLQIELAIPLRQPKVFDLIALYIGKGLDTFLKKYGKTN